MLRLAHFAALGVLLIGTPLQAGQQAVQEDAPQVAGDKPNDPNQVICKQVPPKIGTHLGGGRYCQTRRAWEDMSRQDRELLADAVRRGHLGPTGWY